MHVNLRKICEAPEAPYPAAAWTGFTPGQLGNGNESLPVAYELEGELLVPVTVGQPLLIRRTTRNGVICEGQFTSSPVREFGVDWIRTENSLYRVRIISPADLSA